MHGKLIMSKYLLVLFFLFFLNLVNINVYTHVVYLHIHQACEVYTIVLTLKRYISKFGFTIVFRQIDPHTVGSELICCYKHCVYDIKASSYVKVYHCLHVIHSRYLPNNIFWTSIKYYHYWPTRSITYWVVTPSPIWSTNYCRIPLQIKTIFAGDFYHCTIRSSRVITYPAEGCWVATI